MANKNPHRIYEGDVVINEKAGKWVCQLRAKDQIVREFRFATAESSLAPHAFQTAEGGLSLHPDTIFVETGFGSSAEFDVGWSAEPIRNGTAFGRAWGKDPSLQAMLKALPAK